MTGGRRAMARQHTAPCQSCGWQGRFTLDVTFPGHWTVFTVCTTCAEDAVRNGDAHVVVETQS